MKNLIKAAAFAAAIFASSACFAQSVGEKAEKAAKDVGNKTSEVAAKTASAVVDKKYAGKAGPNGETIYIDKNSHYYYVNKKGKRIYLEKSELREKVDD